MLLPSYAKKAIEILYNNGHKAYAVGGCVRDSIMGIAPFDYDICTSATPNQMLEIFSGFKVIKTGIKHGTVTVIIEDKPLEITTFRKEAEYSDHRRPDSVLFVDDLKDDLSRRDFTVNAIAYNDYEGYVDFFDGIADIKRKTLRCVGCAPKRFEEDALRILRAVRFHSTLGFEIEKNTHNATFEKLSLLEFVSAERIRVELEKLLQGDNVYSCLMTYRDVIAQFIPEIKPCFDFDQKNKHHKYDVYEHIVRAVSLSPKWADIRVCMLLHDIAKPLCMTEDKKGCRHFKTHPEVGAEIAQDILSRLKFDNKTKSYIVNQIKEHDNRFECTKENIKRFISKYSFKFCYDHIDIRLADTKAQGEYNLKEKLDDLDMRLKLIKEIENNNECVFISQLGINGNDLINIGFEGKEISQTLDILLDEVMSGRLCNNKEELMSFAKRRKKEQND